MIMYGIDRNFYNCYYYLVKQEFYYTFMRSETAFVLEDFRLYYEDMEFFKIVSRNR